MSKREINFTCPLPLELTEIVTLAHGSGGTASHKLISEVFLKEFGNKYLNELHDGAVFESGGVRLAYTTDSFVVRPLFFPGGNIGDLAVNGTVNDLAMCGAKPLYISAAFIIEEGLDLDELKLIVRSMKTAADKCGVSIITGDTKVVEKGKGDKVFINTSGIGEVYEGVSISPSAAVPGDAIILSGTIADHGIAVLSSREDLGFISGIRSDTAPLNGLTEILFSVTKDIHVLRDPTRGGLAGILNEISKASGVTMLLREEKIRIKEDVKSACELLGFDPLYIANEGKCLIILPPEHAKRVVDTIRGYELCTDAEIIGEVTEKSEGRVILRTQIGTNRMLDMPQGDQLPRIC